MNLRESAHTFNLLTVNLRLFCGFSVNSRAIDRYFTGFTLKICCREMPRDLKKTGHFPAANFPGKCRKSRKITVNQWRNMRGGRVPPRDFCPGNFCWRTGKKEARKKGKRGENWEEKVENWKWKQKNVRKRGEDLFFFFFFFFFCFSLLKTTKICFGSTKMGIFYREKAFHAGKNNQEKWLCPLRKICLLRPCRQLLVNLRKTRKKPVHWPLIYKMYGYFPVNSRFPVLFYC